MVTGTCRNCDVLLIGTEDAQGFRHWDHYYSLADCSEPRCHHGAGPTFAQPVITDRVDW